MLIPDIIIAIDGYSSTGKSSFAKLIAEELGFLYLDSGAMYRAVTLHAMENGMFSGSRVDEKKLEESLDKLDIHFEDKGDGSKTYIGNRCVEKEIRRLDVSGKVSIIAALPQVRAYVDKRLRELGKCKRVVMDGRDIGTTVFPDAELKIFMVADTRTRAERRVADLKSKGEEADFGDVLRNLEERDYIDSHRKTSPLSQAPDAIVLDNSNMTIPDQMVWIRDIISRKFGHKQ